MWCCICASLPCKAWAAVNHEQGGTIHAGNHVIGADQNCCEGELVRCMLDVGKLPDKHSGGAKLFKERPAGTASCKMGLTAFCCCWAWT